LPESRRSKKIQLITRAAFLAENIRKYLKYLLHIRDRSLNILPKNCRMQLNANKNRFMGTGFETGW